MVKIFFTQQNVHSFGSMSLSPLQTSLLKFPEFSNIRETFFFVSKKKNPFRITYFSFEN